MKTNRLAMYAGIMLSALMLGGAHAGGTLPATISGTKYEDVNANGVKDMGTDRPWSGITIELLDTNGNVIDTRVTDADGAYAFEQLNPGEYTVREDLSFDVLGEIFPTTPIENIVQLDGNGGPETGIDFGNTLFASFHGLKFLDDDGDGMRDPSEAGLAGVGFALSGTDGMGNAVRASLTTDADGHFWFEQLLPGTYLLSEMLIDDMLLTTFPNQRAFTVFSGQELVFQDGAAMLPAGSLRQEVNIGDELVWGNTPAVPEPALLALLGIGLAGMGFTRRRRQSA